MVITDLVITDMVINDCVLDVPRTIPAPPAIPDTRTACTPDSLAPGMAETGYDQRTTRRLPAIHDHIRGGNISDGFPQYTAVN
jgi:hypothetical protein